VPIVVGSIGLEKATLIAETLVDYFKDERTLFCVSSDFCHWGERFWYTYSPDKSIPIFENIKILDKEGMDIIET